MVSTHIKIFYLCIFIILCEQTIRAENKFLKNEENRWLVINSGVAASGAGSSILASKLSEYAFSRAAELKERPRPRVIRYPNIFTLYPIKEGDMIFVYLLPKDGKLYVNYPPLDMFRDFETEAAINDPPILGKYEQKLDMHRIKKHPDYNISKIYVGNAPLNASPLEKKYYVKTTDVKKILLRLGDDQGTGFGPFAIQHYSPGYMPKKIRHWEVLGKISGGSKYILPGGAAGFLIGGLYKDFKKIKTKTHGESEITDLIEDKKTPDAAPPLQTEQNSAQ